MDSEEFFSPSYISDDENYYTADEYEDVAGSSAERLVMPLGYDDPLTWLPLEIVFHIMEITSNSKSCRKC